MAAKSKSTSPRKTGKSAGGSNDNDYPNIIEEPIRVVGDRGKSRKQTKGSGETGAKKSGKKKRS